MRAAPAYGVAVAIRTERLLLRAPALSDVPYPVMMEPNLVVEYYAKN